MDLKDIVEALSGATERPDSRIAIVSDKGAHDESSLVGTRDAYLHLARELVAFVARADELAARGIVTSPEDDYVSEDGAYWTNAVRRALHSFPSSHECGVVGAYLSGSHEEALSLIKRLLPDEVGGWEADPDFGEPVRRPPDTRANSG